MAKLRGGTIVNGDFTLKGNLKEHTSLTAQKNIVGREVIDLNDRDVVKIVSSWTSRTASEASSWRSVTWSPELGIFVAVANAGTNQVMTSPDGINWTGRTAEASDWNSITWSPELGIFVAVAFNGTNRVMTSPDGINWTSRTASEASDWVSVTWSPELGIFVAVSYYGTNQVMTSVM